MNHTTIRSHPLVRLMLVLVVVTGSLAINTGPGIAAGLAAQPRSKEPQDGPEFPGCSLEPEPPSCTNLQVFLLIDVSSSMLYTDQTRQRFEGVKNVLDILAKEYYLPAVDANARDLSVSLPNIQVSLIQFSSEVRHSSGWKTIAPASIDEWATQLEVFNNELDVEIDYYKQEQATDFYKAFLQVKELAAAMPQSPDCPRLVMLFTDGVPNLGDGDLEDDGLIGYMQSVKDLLQPVLPRENDLLYVTAFGSDVRFRRFWERNHKREWEGITRDSAELDPRRVSYVPTKELASRMEDIIGSTIGNQVNTLISEASEPRKYITKIPITVESLRLTYYTINPNAGFSVTGPDGKMIQPDGKNILLTGANTSIQVLEILDPPPGEYQITTTEATGIVTQLLRFERISAVLTSPGANLLQYTNGQVGIQLLGSDSHPIDNTSINIEAALIQDGSTEYLDLEAGQNTFTSPWMASSTNKAAVYACATINSRGNSIILYNGVVGEIGIDPVAVQVGEAGEACVPSDKILSMPVQLINASSNQPALIDVPLEWSASVTNPDGSQLNSNLSEIDAKAGSYVLQFKPTVSGEVRFAITANAIIEGAPRLIPLAQEIPPLSVQPPRQLALTTEAPRTIGDQLSVKFYRWLHPGCLDENTMIVLGRRVFNWLGPTQVGIRGRFVDTGNNRGEPNIERFAIQMVGVNGEPSSDLTNRWTRPISGEEVNALLFNSPGLGLYNVSVIDQGKNPECSALESLPTQKVLLIPDYWETLIPLSFIVLAVVLTLYVFWRYRNRRYGHEIPLIMGSVFLIFLNVVLVRTIVTHTFACELNCNSLIDRPLEKESIPLTPCKGVAVPLEETQISPTFQIGPYVISAQILRDLAPFANAFLSLIGKPPIDTSTIKDFTLGPWVFAGITIPPNILPVLPGLAGIIDPPLQALRLAIAWGAVVLIALGSVVLGFAASKVIGFINLLRTPAGRALVLTNVGIFFFFFVLFTGLFFMSVVR